MSTETPPGAIVDCATESVLKARARVALLAVSATIVVWSASTVAVKTTSTSGLVASFYRLWFAVAGLWLVVLLYPALRSRLNRDWLRASLIGGTLFGLHQIAYFNSVKLTSVANVVILASLQPALVALVAARFFGEKTRLRNVAWSMLAFAGTVAVMRGSSGTGFSSLPGDILAVFNLLFFTAYFLASKQIRTRVGAGEYMVGMTTMAAIVVGVAALAWGEDFTSPTGYDLTVLFIIAVVPGTLGHLVMNWAHPHASAFSISILMLGLPVISSAGALVFLDEPLNAMQIAGGAVALLAIAVVVRDIAFSGHAVEHACRP